MADTIVPAGDPAAVVLYSELTYAQAIRYTTASKLMAVGLSKDDPSNFVQFFEETADKSGDTIKYDLIYNPFGPGIAGDSVIAGNEVPLTYDQDALIINQLRQSMLLKGMMSQQRVPFSLRDKARNGEANWLRTMIDYGLMNQAAGNTGAALLPYVGSSGTDSGQFNYTGMQAPIAPSSDHWLFPGGATTEATVGGDPKYSFTLDMIPDIVALAQGTLSTPIKPVIINGLEIAGVLFLDHLQVKDLKKQYDSGQWGNIMGMAMQGGQVQGNPIFTGALGIFDNVVIHQDTYLPWGDGVTTNLVKNPQTRQMVAAPNSLFNIGITTTQIGRFVFLGAQSVALAVGMADGTPDAPLRVKWVEEPLDANNQLRVTCGMIFGFKKTQFGGSDYAVITGSTYVSTT
jgi:N4-gp56 family major capsid protein